MDSVNGCNFLPRTITVLSCSLDKKQQQKTEKQARNCEALGQKLSSKFGERKQREKKAYLLHKEHVRLIRDCRFADAKHCRPQPLAGRLRKQSNALY